MAAGLYQTVQLHGKVHTRYRGRTFYQIIISMKKSWNILIKFKKNSSNSPQVLAVLHFFRPISCSDYQQKIVSWREKHTRDAVWMASAVSVLNCEEMTAFQEACSDGADWWKIWMEGGREYKRSALKGQSQAQGNSGEPRGYLITCRYNVLHSHHLMA